MVTWGVWLPEGFRLQQSSLPSCPAMEGSAKAVLSDDLSERVWRYGDHLRKADTDNSLLSTALLTALLTALSTAFQTNILIVVREDGGFPLTHSF